MAKRQATTLDPFEVRTPDDFKMWLKKNEVQGATITALGREGFNTFRKFAGITSPDITKLGIKTGQQRLLEDLADEARQMREGKIAVPRRGKRMIGKKPGPQGKKGSKEIPGPSTSGQEEAGVEVKEDNNETRRDSAAGRDEKPNALEAELLRYKAAKKQQEGKAGEEESGPASFTNFGRKKERALSVSYMMTVLKDAPYSVGMIMQEDTHRGTGFRVGRHYLMTCLHVVSGENGLKVKFNHIPGMGLREVIVDINEVVYSEEALDVAILKINGAEQLESRPLQLSRCAVDGPLCFLGHPGFGDNTPMMLDTGIEIIHPDDTVKDAAKVVEYYQTLLQSCSSHVDPHEVYRNCGMSFQRPKEVRFDGMLDDNFRIIHTAFLPGASGSPGVQVDGSGRVTVRLMLCRGFPAFYHELTDVGRALHPMPSQKFRFEHGLDMSRLYEKMCQWVRDGSEDSPERKQFLKEIFG